MRDHVGQRADDPAEIILGKPADLQLTTDTVEIGPVQPRSAETPNHGLISKKKFYCCILLKILLVYYAALLWQ